MMRTQDHSYMISPAWSSVSVAGVDPAGCMTTRLPKMNNTDKRCSHKLYSRQGVAEFVMEYGSLARAINRLLSLDIVKLNNVMLHFDITAPSTGRSGITAVVDTPIQRPPKGKVGPLDELLSMIQEEGTITFVRLPSDRLPATPEPKPMDGGIATIIMEDDYKLRQIAYMRVPRISGTQHTSIRYTRSYQDTMGTLIDVPHHYLTFRVGLSKPVTIYSCEDLPQGLVKDISAQPFCEIKVVATRVDPNTVPVVLPEGDDTRHSGNVIELLRQDLGDLDGLKRVVAHALSRQPDGGKNVIGIQVHYPGPDFQQVHMEGLYLPLANGQPTQAAMNLWSQRIGGHKDADPQGVSMVVQPCFNGYFLSGSHTSRQGVEQFTPIRLRFHDLPLRSFKAKIAAELFLGAYEPQNDRHTLTVEDDVGSFRHVITFHSTNDDWTQICRRLMSQNLHFTLKKNDSDTRWSKSRVPRPASDQKDILTIENRYQQEISLGPKLLPTKYVIPSQ